MKPPEKIQKEQLKRVSRLVNLWKSGESVEALYPFPYTKLNASLPSGCSSVSFRVPFIMNL